MSCKRNNENIDLSLYPDLADVVEKVYIDDKNLYIRLKKPKEDFIIATIKDDYTLFRKEIERLLKEKRVDKEDTINILAIIDISHEIIYKDDTIIRSDEEYNDSNTKDTNSLKTDLSDPPDLSDTKDIQIVNVSQCLKLHSGKVQQLIDDHIRSLKISQLMDVREVTDETFLSDIAKVTNNNKKAQTALIKNKAAQIISIKAHQNPVYYEKMKERLDNLIREEKEKREEDADYFNSYKKILQELLDEENERKKLGFSNMFEFAVYEELLKLLKDKEPSKTFTKKISEGIKQETELVGWKTKTSSEKQLGNIIYDIISEIKNKKLEDNEDKKNELTERFIDLAKRNL